MRVRAAATAAALAAVTTWAGIGGPPAGAAVTGTTSGTTATFTTTMGSSVSPGCNSSGFVANGATAASPPLACSAVTTVTVIGDAGGNYVNVERLGTGFPSLGSVLISPQGGSNLIFASTKREVFIGSNAGQDVVYLPAQGAADGPISLSTGTDTVNVEGTTGDDSIAVTDGDPDEVVLSSGAWSATLTGTEFVGLSGDAGDDTLDGHSLSDAVLTSLTLVGGPGDDTLDGGSLPNNIGGGSGTNSIVAGPVADNITSTSSTDTIEARGGIDTIRDQGTGRAGARTIVGPPSEADLWILHGDGDLAVRTRAGATAGTARVAAALGRTGVQDLPTSIDSIIYQPDSPGTPVDRTLFDITPLPSQLQRITSTSASTLVDLVVPTGIWNVDGGHLTFSGPYADVYLPVTGTVNVRTPFADPEQRFAHRLIRDLEHRIPNPTERDTYRFQLESGALTRAQLVDQIASTDVVRGLAVDRAFVDIMRRATDIPGRAYWVGRLRGGLVIRKLRANLYGSNEYFDAQGDGNVEDYVRAAYLDILGREAEESGLGYWIDLIESGTARGTVADRFLNTSEARTVIVRDLFLRWADREPTAPELSTWSAQLSSSSVDGEAALVRFLAGSSAYFTRPDA